MAKRTKFVIPDGSKWLLIHDYSSRIGWAYKAVVMCTTCFNIFEIDRHNIITGKSKQCQKCAATQSAQSRPKPHLTLPPESNFEIIEEYSSVKNCHTGTGYIQKTWKSKVRCKTCGDITEVRRSSLQTGRAIECNSCSRTGEKHHSFKDKEAFGRAIAKTIREHPERQHGWKGGITEISKHIRSAREYKQWVQSIYERDNYTCQFTGIKGVRLAAHHKKPLKTIIDEYNIKTLDDALNCPDIWDLSNGITMSAAYHMKFHLYLSKSNCNNEV